MITKPKGCYDLFGKDSKKWQYFSQLIDFTMEKYNYNFIRTPIFEESELFHRGIGESSDIVTKETYDFVDKGNRKMTLRPEGTAGVVRSYIENKMYGDPTQPVKLYYNGPMYRYERPQAGRNREFFQFGIEVLGSKDPMVDAEVISIPYQLYQMLGLKEVRVEINSLGDKESRDAYRKALIDYFTPHIEELCDDCKNRLQKNPLRILDCKVDAENKWIQNAPHILDYLNEESQKHFEEVKKYLDILKIPYIVNQSIVRGLDYYNHTVFELKTKLGETQIALGGGGRYNGLVEELGGPATPSMGFACGVDRVMLSLEEANVSLPIKEGIDVFLFNVNEEEKDYALYLSQELRLAGFSCDLESMGRSMKAQFKQADRLQAKFLLLLNSEDLDHNMVTIKNNRTKEEETIDLDYLIYYLDEKLGEEEEEMNEKHCHCDEECCEEKCTCGDDCHSHEEHHCGCQDGKECTCEENTKKEEK